MVRTGMAIGLDGRARKLGAGIHAGMRELVDQDQVAGSGKRGDNAGIGQVSRTKHHRGVGTLDARQPAFERRVKRVIAGDQARRPGAHAVAFGRLDCRLDHTRMLAEIEVIVA